MTDQQQMLAQHILEVLPLVMRTLAAELRQGNPLIVPAHFQLLWILQYHSCSLSELAERQSVSLPTMSNTVTILEERGWIQRQRSAADRRKVVIEITPAGQAVLTEVGQRAQEKVSEIISELSAEEQAELLNAMQLLRRVFVNVMQHEGCMGHDEKP